MMIQMTRWWIAGALLAGALVPAWGQEGKVVPTGEAAPPASAEAASLAEQIAVLKGINPLRLSGEQVQALLDVIKPATGRIEQQDQIAAKQMVAVVPQLRQAALQADTAPAQTSPAELEYRRLQQLRQQTRDRARFQLRDNLRELLEKLLTPEQRTGIIATGRAYNLQTRLQQWQAQNGGPIEGTARSLDQLRQADPQRYQQERQMFALRQADVPNVGQMLRRGGGNGAGNPGGFGGGNRGGGPGGPRGRGGAQIQLPPELQQQLNDPAVQARMRPYLAMADQVRRMPDAAYQQQRVKLALQVWQARDEQRVQTRPEESIDAFIDHYLLSDAAVVVLEAKRQQAG